MRKVVALLLALAMMLTVVSLASADETGKVYYLNFKPEADQAWQDLAAEYTKQTGVEVKVLTAASGSYSDTLTSEMEKKDAAPTLFQIGNAEGVMTWGDYALALDGTDLMNEMTTADFNLKNANGETVAVGYCYEAYGIITNKALLEKAGYTVADIKDFESLKKVADDIHARSAELGFDAFVATDMDDSSSWRVTGHLANLDYFYEERDDGGWDECPATIKGTYVAAQGIALTGILTASDWGEDRTVTFNFDETNIPVAGTRHDGYYVVSVNQTARTALLRATSNVPFTAPGNTAADALESQWLSAFDAALASYPKPADAVGDWRLPTYEEACIFLTDASLYTATKTAVYFCLKNGALNWCYVADLTATPPTVSSGANYNSSYSLRPVITISY